jgi:hypothetical protein
MDLWVYFMIANTFEPLGVSYIFLGSVWFSYNRWLVFKKSKSGYEIVVKLGRNKL